MKGVARADGQPSADYEAVVLAFSRLSQAVVADQPPGGALATAVETAAVLLQTDWSSIVLVGREPGTLEVAASHDIDFSAFGSPLPGAAIIEECIDSHSLVLLPQISQDKRKGVQELVRLGVASVLAVPIWVGDGVVGALMVMSGSLRSFSAGDIQVLTAIAEQVGFAAWRRGASESLTSSCAAETDSQPDDNLIELANRKIRELSIVNRVSEAVISTLDLSKLLNLALEECLYAVGAGVGSIMLLDEDYGLLVIKAAKGISQEVIDTVKVEVGQGIAGWVAEHGEPVLVEDARHDARFHMHRYRDDITSAMSVPLKARGRVIGVLNASTIEVGRHFGPREIQFLSTVANQAAMAIDNAALYDRLNERSKELAGLLSISEAITSTLELREILSLLAERLMSVSHVDVGALLVFDADTSRFRCLDGQGLSTKSKRSAYMELASPIASRTLAAGVPICCEVLPDAECATEVSAKAGLVSAVGVPLLAGDRLVGVTALFSKKARAFPPTELATLAALGKLAGVAVHNALIYQHKYEIARALQFKLVPNVPISAEGLEIGHKFSPAREVGGDYYDLLKVVPGKVGIVIADVAGNSVPAALYTSMGKNVLRAYAIDNESPADVLCRLNRIACDETQAEVFISLFYGIFDSATRTFRYACAGHEPPVLFHPDGTYELLRGDGLLIGISPEISYEEKDVSLPQGSILVMFTDGLVDSPAVRGKFGVPQLAEIVNSAFLQPAQTLADNIHERLMEIAGNNVQDDVALMVLKVV